MLAALMFLWVAEPQREPVEVREPLPQVLETLRDGSRDAAFERALDRLPELLQSPQGEMVEVGAFLAGEHGRVECREALVEALRRDSQGRYGKRTRVRERALDAMIRLESAPPLELLFHDGSHDLPETSFAAVMWERDRARRCDGLAKLFERTAYRSNAHWAAAIELVRERDSRVVGPLLFGEQWTLQVLVVEPDGRRSFTGGGEEAISGDGTRDWRFALTYTIALPGTTNPLKSAEVSRSAHASATWQTNGAPSRFLADWWRLRLLAELTPVTKPLRMEELFVTTHAADADSLGRVVEQHVAMLRKHIDVLQSELHSADLLRSKVEVVKQARIHVELRDVRIKHDIEIVEPKAPPGVRITLVR